MFSQIFFFIIFSSLIISQYEIGSYSVIFQDPDRSDRNIETKVYYPAVIEGDSLVTAPEQFPVIVFGHGFIMTWDTYENIWEELVPKGFIMAFPTTEGGLFSTDHQEFGWDLKFLVSKIQEEGLNSLSPIYNSVDNNTAIMGHSMGGGAAFLAADSLCTNGNNQLKTIVALAPAESSSNGVSSIASASNIDIPSLILFGSQDGVTPPASHSLPIYNNLSSNRKTLISISGGGHCYFANSNIFCDLAENTSSTGISISRDEQQDITFDFLNLWLDYSLKDDCGDFSVFQDSLFFSERITYEQSWIQNPVANIIEDEGILITTVLGTNYQWYFNNDLIPNANESTYSPINNGEYIVEVFFSSGCPTLSNPYNFFNDLGELTTLKPTNYKIFQNYPNPFNPVTSIQYELPKNSYVRIIIYDMLGNVTKNLVDSNRPMGYRLVNWDATNNQGQSVPAGVYLYMIEVGKFKQARKMTLLK
ncbi:MAG: hypothetical protein CMG63_03245 [Candidatus Marinimicrobia bacterium]|nr:hypothetical protein [Candidatus Neomarinimicrobiota bacterium]